MTEFLYWNARFSTMCIPKWKNATCTIIIYTVIKWILQWINYNVDFWLAGIHVNQIVDELPGMIEFGLEESATVELNRQLSPTLRTTSSDGSEEFLEVCYHDEKVNYRSPKKDKQVRNEITCDTTIFFFFLICFIKARQLIPISIKLFRIEIKHQANSQNSNKVIQWKLNFLPVKRDIIQNNLWILI